jgi:hypothetical protein
MFSLADADGHEAEACEDRFMVMPRTPRGKKEKHDDEVRIMTRKQLNDMCFTTSTLALEMRVGLTTLRSDTHQGPVIWGKYLLIGPASPGSLRGRS